MAFRYDGEEDFGGGVLGFHFSDPDTGEKFLLDDPMEAEQLKAQLQPFNDANMMADASAVPDYLASGLAQSGHRPAADTRVQSRWDAPPVQFTPEELSQAQVAPVGSGVTVQPPQPKEVYVPGLAPQGGSAVAAPEVDDPRARRQVHVPYSAARPEKWQASQFTLAPQADPATIQERDKLFEDERELIEQRREIESEENQAKIYEAKARVGHAWQQAFQANAQKNAYDAEVKRRADIIDKAQKAVDSKEVDPRRYFKNKNTAENIGLAVSFALSELGATMQTIGTGVKHTGGAGEFIKRAIDQDIDMQREEIARGYGDVELAKNSLAEFYRAYGDPQSAENQLRIIAENVAQKELALNRAETQDPLVQQAIDEEILASKQRQAEFRMKITESASPTVAGVVTPERAASGGYDRPETDDEYYKRRKRELELDKTEAETQKLRREASGDDDLDKDVQALSKRYEDTGLTEAGAGLQQVYQAIQNATGGDPNADIPGVGGFIGALDFIGQSDIATALSSEKGKDVRVAMMNAADLILRSRTGAVVHPSELEQLKKISSGNFNTDAEFKRGLEVLSRVFRAKEQNINKGYGSRVVDTYRNRNPASSGLAPMPGNTIQFEPIR